MCSHQEWLSSIYLLYEYEKTPTECDREVVLDEKKYRDIVYETQSVEEFEQEWLKWYPPLIKRQNGFFR